MTMTELKQIAASCQSNAEFVSNPKVREVYCKCLGTEGPWLHSAYSSLAYSDRCMSTLCSKCGQEYDWPQSRPTCPVPDPIPGSLADANEQLRAKYDVSTKGDRDKSLIIFSHDTPRQVFTSYAAALGGVAVEEK